MATPKQPLRALDTLAREKVATQGDARLLEELLKAHTLDLPHIRKIVKRIRIRSTRVLQPRIRT